MTDEQKEYIADQMAMSTVQSLFEHFGSSQRAEAREVLDKIMRKLTEVAAADDEMTNQEKAGMR